METKQLDPFLCIGTTLATLNWSGTKPVENEQLKSSCRGVDKTPFKVLSREVEILNGPQALVELRDIIIFSISVELVGDKKTRGLGLI